jgi:hypothetical protein
MPDVGYINEVGVAEIVHPGLLNSDLSCHSFKTLINVCGMP